MKATADFISVTTSSSLCREDLIYQEFLSQILLSSLQEPSANQSPRLDKTQLYKTQAEKELKGDDVKIRIFQAELNKYRKKVSKLRNKKSNIPKLLTKNCKRSQMT